MMQPLLRPFGAVAVAVALALLLLSLSSSDSSANHQTLTKFTPATTLNFSTNAANTSADVITTLNLPADNVNFGANVGFIPPEWGVAGAGDLPIGELVGTVDSVVQLGILSGPCAVQLDVHFDLLNGSVNTADTISGLPAGTDNRLQPLIDDVNPANGIPDGADRYPDYLNEIFPGITPKARLVGTTIITSASNLPVVLNFVLLDVGTQLPESDLIQDPPFLDDRLGFPSVTVLQDPTEPAAPSAVTDFCAPLQANTTIFDNVRSNPAPRTYTWVAFTASQRDADGDGFENILDTCPFQDNNENPKDAATSENPDGDGLDSACDPNDPNNSSPCGPGTGDDFFGSDCDADQFLNRGDNCPLEPNITQADDDNDGIGDACDIVGAGGFGKGPNVADGEPIELCIVTQVDIGGGGPADFVDIAIGDTICQNVAVAPGDGPPPPTPTAAPTTDSDGDGVPDADDKCADTASGASVDEKGCSKEQLEKVLEETKEDITTALGETLAQGEVGLGIDATFDTVDAGTSTDIVVVCAEKQNGLKLLPGVDITFQIDSQPGSDADLDGQAEMTVTTDAEGSAVAKLNVGSTPGEIVVSAEGGICGTATTTVTVEAGSAVAGAGTGPTGAAGGAATGIGSLAPVVGSIPAWAAIVSALGGAGLLGSLGAMAARILRRRRQ